MRYLERKFCVGLSTKAYRDGWDTIYQARRRRRAKEQNMSFVRRKLRVRKECI